DEKIRREMQEELRRIQQATAMTFIYVTHDQEEALTMSDRIAVLNRGVCVQCDAPEAIFRRPRTRFVAEFFRGCNVIEGEHERTDGRSFLRIGSATAELPMSDFPPGRIAVAIRGEDVHLGKDAEGRELVLEARVEGRVYRGLYTDYRLVLEDGQSLSAMTGRDLEVAAGDEVRIGLDAAAVVPLHEA
ncbi:MAG: TOBE domain-containing protein, partial [bacterium]